MTCFSPRDLIEGFDAKMPHLIKWLRVRSFLTQSPLTWPMIWQNFIKVATDRPTFDRKADLEAKAKDAVRMPMIPAKRKILLLFEARRCALVNSCLILTKALAL